MNAERLYIEHLHARIKSTDEALEKAYNIIEGMDKKITNFEQEIQLLVGIVRDLEIKMQYEQA